MDEKGVRQRYDPIKDVWTFEAPMVLGAAAMMAAVANARRIQASRLKGRKPGPMTDAIRASVQALDTGRVVQGAIGAIQDYRVFKATTREHPERSITYARR